MIIQLIGIAFIWVALIAALIGFAICTARSIKYFICGEDEGE